MSQLSAWAARQQAVRADRPADLGQGPHELRWARAAITDDGLVAVSVNGPLHEAEALRLGRWLMETCGEEPTRYSPDEFHDLDWRAAVREWAERCKVKFPSKDAERDKGWNEALGYLVERLATIQPRRLSGLAAREEEG